MTLQDSIVSDNLASVSDPNGRFAEGGGVFTEQISTVSIDHSQIVGNTAGLTSSFPYFIGGGETLELGANSGGLHLSADNGEVTIANSRIDSNTVDVTALNGEPEAFDAGMCACGNPTLDLSDSSISNNRIDANIGSNADLFADTGFAVGGAIEFDALAKIDHVLITGNSTSVMSPTGAAIANGTVASFFPAPPTNVLSHSAISNNRVKASSPKGSSTILGVGLMNAAGLDLEDDVISGNVGIATGPTGVAQGAGIWNGPFPNGPPVGLTVNGTTVFDNILVGSAGISLQGGGLFSSALLTLGANTIANNKPDNCFGATC